MTLPSCRQNDRRHARGISDAVSEDRRSQMLHRVDDRQPGGNASPGREEIQVDRFARILGLIVEKLQDNTVSEVGIHRLGQVEDA